MCNNDLYGLTALSWWFFGLVEGSRDTRVLDVVKCIAIGQFSHEFWRRELQAGLQKRVDLQS